MKFVHIADMHFDSPFVNLSDKDGLGDLRRLDQRKTFKKVIEYIKENDLKYLFISGDLYEQKYIKKSTIEYINNLFKEIPKTKIFIAPGNHDPYIKNSYYNKFNWNENVKIFNSNIEKVELEDADIYGFGFDEFYCKKSGIEDIEIEDKNKLNILVIHGSLYGGTIENSEYNPLSRRMLKEKCFDYVALGHIHKLDYNQEENQNIVYPGSTVSLGFDELGPHGMIVGNIEKVELEEANIYGFGFDDFYCKKSGIEDIEIEDKNKVNILVIHGSLDGGTIENSEYNPLARRMLKEKGFDYVALGHIHKLDYNQEENQNIVYPGSTVSLGFDELGLHGMIVGDLEKDKLQLEFVPLDETEFKLQDVDVTEINSKEELIEKINELEFAENNLIEIILIGKRNFEIDKYELYKLILKDKIIKIKNKTKINYNLKELANDTTLKGLFAKEMLKKLNEDNLTEEDKEIIEKAVEIGLEALE